METRARRPSAGAQLVHGSAGDETFAGDARDADDKAVGRNAHASIELVASGVVVTRLTRLTIEERAKTLRRIEVAFEHVRALRDRAARSGAGRVGDHRRRHVTGTERRDLEDHALPIRRRGRDPNRPCVLGDHQPGDTELRQVGLIARTATTSPPCVIRTIVLSPGSVH